MISCYEAAVNCVYLSRVGCRWCNGWSTVGTVGGSLFPLPSYSGTGLCTPASCCGVKRLFLQHFSMSEPKDQSRDIWIVSVDAGTYSEDLDVAKKSAVDSRCSPSCSAWWSSSYASARVWYPVLCCCPQLLVTASDTLVGVVSLRRGLISLGHGFTSIRQATSERRILMSDWVVLLHMSNCRALNLRPTALSSFSTTCYLDSLMMFVQQQVLNSSSIYCCLVESFLPLIAAWLSYLHVQVLQVVSLFRRAGLW